MERFYTSGTVLAIALIMVLGACAATFKLQYAGLTDSSDYQEYVATAQYIAGDEGAEPVPHRYLKPLFPLILAALATMMEYETATLVFAVVCYFAFILAMFLLANEFLQNRFTAALITLMAALSYPVIRYGIEINAETGAWFMYTLSLWLTLRFIKQPTALLFFGNALLITVGFLYKEYSIVSAVALGLSVLFHTEFAFARKARYIALYALLFLGVHIPWQIYVYLTEHYSYFSWFSYNATAGYSQGEFSVRTFVKSTAAVLGLAWLLIPLGIVRVRSLDRLHQRFIAISGFPPLMGYAWGYIQSRLLYVIAPPALLIAGLELQKWRHSSQAVFTVVVLIANMAWLVLAYKITL